MPPRRVPSTKRSNQKESSSEYDLSSAFTAKLTLVDRKGKQKEATVSSPEETCMSAMRAVNSASKKLSAIIDSGWSSRQDTQTTRGRPSTTLSTVNEQATSIQKNLRIIREMKPGDVDVERAASSVTGKLISLEMYSLALVILREMRTSLVLLFLPRYQLDAADEHLILLPFGPSDTEIPDVTLNLISTFLVHALTVISFITFSPSSQSEPSSFVRHLSGHSDMASKSQGTLLDWLPTFSSKISPKQLDSLLTKSYTALSKSTAVPKISGSPDVIYAARIYALKCLAYTSPEVLEPASFWEQVIKFTHLYTSSMSSEQQIQTEATKHVLAAFSSIVDILTILQPKASFVEPGKGFNKFIDYWISFARRDADIAALDRISSLCGSDVRNPNQSGADDGTMLCALLTRITTILESETSCQSSSLREARDVLDRVGRFFTAIHAQNDEEGGKNLKRGLERLRRVILKSLENSADPTSSKDALKSILTTLEIINAKSLHLDQDVLSTALDSVVTLSKKALGSNAVQHPGVFEESFDLLSRGERLLLHYSSLDLSPEDTRCLANYIRVVSGVFYSLSGNLYQSGSYAIAVRFLDKACLLASQALDRYQQGNTGVLFEDKDDKHKERDEAFNALQQQMFKRWEILGVCLMKIGDRKPAYEAFIKSIKSYPLSSSSLDKYLFTSGSIFDLVTSLKPIASLVDRVTYIACCELLLPPKDVSLLALWSPLGNSIDRLAVGVLLERQIVSLQSSLYKPNVRQLVKSLLKDCLEVYKPDIHPIRRAGILIRILEDHYFETGGDSINEEEVEREVKALLNQKELGKDSQLAHFKSQYWILLHVWLALLVHASSSSSIPSEPSTSTSHPVTPVNVSRIVVHCERIIIHLKEVLSSTPRLSASPCASRLPKPRTSLGRAGSAVVRSPVRRGVTIVPSAPVKRAPVRKGIGSGAKVVVAPAATRAEKAPVTPRPKRGAAAKVVQPLTKTPPLLQPNFGTSVKKSSIEDVAKVAELLRTLGQLLGLLGQVVTKIQILNLTRRLCERFLEQHPDQFIQVSIDLASEYVKLGKTERASSIYNHALPTVKNAIGMTEETIVVYYLRFSELLGTVGNVSKASSVYREARTLSDSLDQDDKGLSTAQRIRLRAATLERAALAATTFAVIQYSNDDPTASLRGLLQALRLWHRAVDTLFRLKPPSKVSEVSSDNSNPFDMTTLKDALPDQTQASQPALDVPQAQPKPKPLAQHSTMDALEWRIASGLMNNLLSLTQAYYARGSAREAEYFAQQAQDFAESLNMPAMISRALTRIGELRLHMGKIEEAVESLGKAAELLVVDEDKVQTGSLPIELVELRRIRADIRLLKDGEEGRARVKALYAESMKMLEELEEVFVAMDGLPTTGSRKSLGVSPRSLLPDKSEVLVPSLLVAVLRQNISLLHDSGEEYRSLLERLKTLPPSAETKAEENALLAKLTLDDAYTRFQTDMFLSSLTESTITLPMGIVGKRIKAASPTTQEIMNILNTAEKLFWSDLTLVAKRGTVAHVREAVVSLALIRAFQTCLGKVTGQDGLILTARLLDSSAAITLNREMLEAIQYKLRIIDAQQDDLQWPSISPNGSVLPFSPQLSKGSSFKPRSSQKTGIRRFPSLDNLDISSDDDRSSSYDAGGPPSPSTYWEFISQRYQDIMPSSGKSSSNNTPDILPSHWTVISITLTEDKKTLFITRKVSGREPLIFCVPMKGRRSDNDEEEDEEAEDEVASGNLTFDTAVKELKDIIQLSDEGTRGAIHVKKDDREARIKWWTDRAQLDKRMKDLLENVEFCWLGVFKTILNQQTQLSPDLLSFFRTRLEEIFKRNLATRQDKNQHRLNKQERVKISDALLECFATLSIPSPKTQKPSVIRDEELEDLVYFILDLYQFSGVPVVISEVDVDQVVVDLRGLFEELTAKLLVNGHPRDRKRNNSKSKTTAQTSDMLDSATDEDQHTFLILDKNVQGFPWESIPSLRGRSVSRVPSLEFLLDRVFLAKFELGEDLSATSPTSPSSSETKVDRAQVNPRKTYFILNPSGDLKNTEARFSGWLHDMKKAVGWQGIMGRPPSEQQMADVLEKMDLVIYFGHGGAEQYIRSHKIRHLSRCAATMLWGCSSGALRDMGDFDRVGTPYHYMLAGCPTLVANLWDVTDRDIDKFSQSVFDIMHLDAPSVKNWNSNGSQDLNGRKSTSIAAAISQSRDCCKLKYLTGAAPIMYGIPFYL
ncbi:hypothetical protein ABKN59_011524 [Abortiporus biennis]